MVTPGSDVRMKKIRAPPRALVQLEKVWNSWLSSRGGFHFQEQTHVTVTWNQIAHRATDF